MWSGEPHPFPKDDHLPDWARRDNKVTKGDRVEHSPNAVFEWAELLLLITEFPGFEPLSAIPRTSVAFRQFSQTNGGAEAPESNAVSDFLPNIHSICSTDLLST